MTRTAAPIHWEDTSVTPAVVHFGQAATVRAHRQQVLALAYTAHPEPFVKGRPQPADLPNAV